MKTLGSKRFPLLELAEMHAMSDLVFGKCDNTDWKISSTLPVFSVLKNIANSGAGQLVDQWKCPKLRHRASHYAHMWHKLRLCHGSLHKTHVYPHRRTLPVSGCGFLCWHTTHFGKLHSVQYTWTFHVLSVWNSLCLSRTRVKISSFTSAGGKAHKVKFFLAQRRHLRSWFVRCLPDFWGCSTYKFGANTRK